MVGHGAALSESPGVPTAAFFSGLTDRSADSSAKLFDQLKVGAQI